MSSKLLDTEAGGEQINQYEGVDTLNKPHKKSEGVLSHQVRDEATEAEHKREVEKGAKGKQQAENIRYGQTISEQGFSGQTQNATADQDEYERGDGLDGETDQTSRTKQGYGSGSGVGG